MTGHAGGPPGASPPPPAGPGGYWQQFDGSQRGGGPGPYRGFTPGVVGPRVHQLAIMSLVSSLVGFVSWAFCPAFPLGFGTAAIVLAVLSMRRIKKEPDQWTGRGLAVGGLVVGIVCLVLFLAFAFFMGFAAVMDTTY